MFWLNPDDRARVQACQTRLGAMDASWTPQGGTSTEPTTQWVIARADFAAAYFEQTGSEDLWDDWVRIELVADLHEAQTDPERGCAAVAGWVEVLGCERLGRLLGELAEDDPTALIVLLRNPQHHDTLRDCLKTGALWPHQSLWHQAQQTHDEALSRGLQALALDCLAERSAA